MRKMLARCWLQKWIMLLGAIDSTGNNNYIYNDLQWDILMGALLSNTVTPVLLLM